jgi:hypothetical protein
MNQPESNSAPTDDAADQAASERARSPGLLPADAADDDDNSALNVAEEVAFDQQSDRVRHLGNLPEDGGATPAGDTAAAVAKTLHPDDDAAADGSPA